MAAENTTIKIDTSKIFEDFEKHLRIDKNNRILFSSKFGTGKSTFLTEYFSQIDQKFVTLTLYPVEYSTAASEDIFELIKFDIIYQLMVKFNNELNLVNEDYSPILKFQFDYLSQVKYGPLFFKMLSIIDPTGKVKELTEFWDDVTNGYEKFKDEHESEEANLFKFIFKEGEKKGSPRERDYFSILIAELLEKIRFNSTQFNDQSNEDKIHKEVALVIDDIDRLDPEQIFRLFNIFSVNFGKDAISNKFGFDKIIFVCDIENIRGIYKHRFGKDVDFEGYIDKFYSISPYKFDTNQFLTNYLREFISNFEIDSDYVGTDYKSTTDYYIILENILGVLIKSKEINLRTLLNIKAGTLANKEFYLFFKRSYYTSQFPLIFMFNFLELIFDTTKEVNDLLIRLKIKYEKGEQILYNNYHTKGIVGGDLNEIINFALPFILLDKDLKEIYDSYSDQGNLIVFLPQYECEINFRYSPKYGGRNEKDYMIHYMHQKGNEENRVYINPFQIIYDSFLKCQSIGAL
ncbi:P-loop NTPase fold protein [Chryseobacterium hagamense]|uniref:KAP NTPase domain-containing protein n=1 Tax=Chryseobacterium hagamense TaxID=395935 RepID=A0A511YP20_9FLAO|nr:P-loop NTPase fold protein [Chryseobacterium hagamense]GEN76916.1 hypothetical protein CHA01nite_26560 [Chryseobacterium hagamense]